MIRQMKPALQVGRFAFTTVPDGEPADTRNAIATLREAEGLSLVLPADEVPGAPVMRQITLQVFSALDGVGLTAAVAAALAEGGIPANVVAGFHHDHVFVPEADADRAVGILRGLAAST